MWTNNNKGQYTPLQTATSSTTPATTPATTEKQQQKEFTEQVIKKLSGTKLVVRLNPLHQASKMNQAQKESTPKRYHPYSEQPSQTTPAPSQKKKSALLNHYHNQRDWVDSEIARKTEENGIRKRNLGRYAKEPLFQMSLQGMKNLTLMRIKAKEEGNITYEDISRFFNEFEKFRVYKCEEQMYCANKDYLEQLTEFKNWLETNELEVIYSLADERRKLIYNVRKQKVDERAARLGELRDLMKRFLPGGKEVAKSKVEVKRNTLIEEPKAKVTVFKPFEGHVSPEGSPEVNQSYFRVLQINGKAPLAGNPSHEGVSQQVLSPPQGHQAQQVLSPPQGHQPQQVLSPPQGHQAPPNPPTPNLLEIVNTWLKQDENDPDPYYDKLSPLTWEFKPPTTPLEPERHPILDDKLRTEYIFDMLSSPQNINIEDVYEDIKKYDEFLNYRKAKGLPVDFNADYADEYDEYIAKLTQQIKPKRIWKEGEYLSLPSSFTPETPPVPKVEDLSTAKMQEKRQQHFRDMQRDLDMVKYLHYADQAREEKYARDMAVWEWNETFWASHGKELFPQEPQLPLHRYTLVRAQWAH